jgi:sulfur-oxidizing protein SoxY
MDADRRAVLRSAGRGAALAAALAAGLLKAQRAHAAGWNKDAFGAKTPADALKGIGAANAAESKDLLIEAPQIAENGGVVPIEITSNVPGTKSIAVLIEKNPFPLAAHFEFKEGALPFVKLNVKIGESSNVRAVAEAGGKFYVAVKEIKVTIGGCGG